MCERGVQRVASDHVRGRAVENHVPDHSHQGHLLQPAHSVLVLQEVVTVHRHFKHILIHQDLQLQTETETQTGGSGSRSEELFTVRKVKLARKSGIKAEKNTGV